MKRVIADERLKRKEKIFDALEWLAAMCSHVPNRGKQMVRYYGYYSNLYRGKREKQDKDDATPSIAVKYFICYSKQNSMPPKFRLR